MKKLLPLVLLALLLIVSRVFAAHDISLFANLQPLGALFFCAMACHQVKWLWIPTIAWLGSYSYTSAVQGYSWGSSFFIVLAGLLCIVGIGHLFRGKGNLQLLGGSILGATAFYLITNSATWFISPLYAKSLSGLIQALWTGLPQFSDTPTWMFFRNSLISTTVFTSVFLLARHRLAEPSVAALEEPA